MKLICPKCQAQYEIPDVAIPDTGRDVQCANCNETWFQAHPDAKAPSGPGAAAAEVKPSDVKPSDVKPSDVKSSDVKPSDDAKPAVPPAPIAAQVTEPAAPRRELSPAVSDILRQEAAREKDARSAKAKLPEAGAKPSLADTRPGRERLPEIPDIDVSNPRLNPRPAPVAAADVVFDVDTDLPEVVRKTGFKRGFSLILLLIGMALMLYVFAPELAQKFPNLREPLTIYVNAINSGRLWLNDLVSGLSG